MIVMLSCSSSHGVMLPTIWSSELFSHSCLCLFVCLYPVDSTVRPTQSSRIEHRSTIRSTLYNDRVTWRIRPFELAPQYTVAVRSNRIESRFRPFDKFESFNQPDTHSLTHARTHARIAVNRFKGRSVYQPYV